MKVYSDVHQHVIVSLVDDDGRQTVRGYDVHFREKVADVPPDVAAILLRIGSLPTARPGEYYALPDEPEIAALVEPEPGDVVALPAPVHEKIPLPKPKSPRKRRKPAAKKEVPA